MSKHFGSKPERIMNCEKRQSKQTLSISTKSWTRYRMTEQRWRNFSTSVIEFVVILLLALALVWASGSHAIEVARSLKW